jgi:hypothetical protein
MVRTWISPSGEWRPYIARNDAVHLKVAEEIVAKNLYAIPIDCTPSETLLRYGWVRYSIGNVEGQPEAISRHWATIQDFADSDVLRFGLDDSVWFDIWDDQERVRSVNTQLRTLLRSEPPAWLFREQSIVQQFHQRRPEVFVRTHRRRA